MANQISLFENSQFGSVRFIPEGDSFWVVGADVLRALEYSDNSDADKIFASVPTEWACRKPITARHGAVENTREMLCLSEQGLYFFLGRSDKPKALPYQMWVAGTVVPSIRKTGSYMPNFNDPIEAAEAWLKEAKAKREALALAKEKQLALTQEQAAHAMTKQELAETREINTELLVRLDLAETYQTVKSMQIWHKIVLPTLPTGKVGNQKFWIPLGRELVKLCKLQGGAYLPYDRRPATYGEFKLRKEWDIVRIADSEWGQINTYPTCARELFIKRLAQGYYENAGFREFLREDYQVIINS